VPTCVNRRLSESLVTGIIILKELPSRLKFEFLPTLDTQSREIKARSSSQGLRRSRPISSLDMRLSTLKKRHQSNTKRRYVTSSVIREILILYNPSLNKDIDLLDWICLAGEVLQPSQMNTICTTDENENTIYTLANTTVSRDLMGIPPTMDINPIIQI